MTDKLYSEILAEFDAAESRKEKIDVLKKYDHNMFREFLIGAFNEGVIFDAPIPTYRPAPEPAGLNYTYLTLEMPKMYRFAKGHPKRNPDLTAEKQKELLLVILEALHKDEAELLVKMMKKDLGVKFLTPKLIKEAYPDIAI